MALDIQDPGQRSDLSVHVAVGSPGLWSHPYCILIFVYLLSIWLSGRTGIFACVASLIGLFVGLGVEPLAALEPIRWWYLYQTQGNWRAVAFRSAPYVALIVLVALVRVVWLVPSGPYAGYNTITLDALNWARYIKASMSFFLDMFRQYELVQWLFSTDPLVALALVSAAVGISIAAGKRETAVPVGSLLVLGALGSLIALVGTLPYAAISRAPTWHYFHSRFAVASQFGILLFIAASIHVVPWRALRMAISAVVLFFFAAVLLQTSKWSLFEEQVLTEFRKEIAGYLKSTEPQVLSVRFSPPSSDIMFRRRTLSSYDFNVWLDLTGNRHGSFLVDAAHAFNFEGSRCSISSYDVQQCPDTRRTVAFELHAGVDRFYKLSALQLIGAQIRGPDFKFGKLVVSER